VKNKKRSDGYQGEACGVVPLELVAQIQHGKYGEDRQGDHFLDGLELRGGEFVGADAVGGHLKAIFEEGDAQLARMTFQSASLRYFRWPYQAKVMKIFEKGEQENG
jgi:hypothetical protein